MAVTARVKKTPGYGERLMVYRNGSLTEIINIDRTFYGPEWCGNHDMVIAETVDADNGEMFDIWRRSDELVCAITVREKGE